MDCTNEWELNNFDLDLIRDTDWDQYIQEPPPPENSCLESPKSPPNNNVEEPERNSGMRWSFSLTNVPSILSFGDPTSPIELEAIPIPVIKKKVSNKPKNARSTPAIEQ